MASPTPQAQNRERSYLNTIMTVIAALLAVIAFDLVVGTPAPSEAVAADRSPTTGGGQFNPAAQRQEMIVELRKLNGQMNKIEKALGGAIEVDVVRMPSGGNGD